jgi:hypothetical protein
MKKICIVMAAAAVLCGAAVQAYDPMPDPRMARGGPGSGAGVMPPIGVSSFVDGLPTPTTSNKRQIGQPRFGTEERNRISGAGGYDSFDRRK